MRMDTRIPMMGQPVNALGRLREGIQTAGIANEVGDQNRLRDVFSAQGAGIMQGDPAALQALATTGPQGGQMALGVQRQQQEMEIQRERLSMARQSAAQQSAQFALQLADRERDQIMQVLSTRAPAALAAAEQGDVAAFNAIIDPYREILGYEPAQSAREMELQAASIAGMADGFGSTYEASTLGQQGGDLSEAEQQVRRIMETGVDRETAILIRDNVITVSRDPVTSEVVLIDQRTGQPWAGSAQPGQPAPVAPQPAAPAPASPGAATTPNLGFGAETTGSTNAENAFGLRGVVGNIGNTVSDALGFGEVAPEVAENQRYFRVLEEDLVSGLAQAGYDRQPALQIMERLRQLMPNAGSLEGANRAIGELRALDDRFASELATVRRQLDRRLSPQDRARLQEQADGLEYVLNRVNEALNRFSSVNPQGGATADDEALIQRYLD